MVTNELFLNPGVKVFLANDSIGDGAIEATSVQVTNLQRYPVGSRYFDKTNKKEYRRISKTATLADWVGGAILA